MKLITVDFDDTLFSLSDEKVGLLWVATEELIPIQKIHDFILEKHKEGYLIDIVTSPNSWDIPEVKQYVEAYKLPIRDIHHTAGKPKAKLLKELGSELHLDDNVYTGLDCIQHNIQFLLVDDGRHKNNSTAEILDRILI